MIRLLILSLLLFEHFSSRSQSIRVDNERDNIILDLQLNSLNSKFFELTFSNWNYFFCFYIEANDYKGQVIVKSSDIYDYLTADSNMFRKGWNYIESKRYLEKIMRNNDTLKIPKVNIRRFKGIEIVSPDPTVDEYAKQGEFFFIHHFFNEYGEVNNAFYDHAPSIIAKLFEWRIAFHDSFEEANPGIINFELILPDSTYHFLH